jgi:hypothetical protein
MPKNEQVMRIGHSLFGGPFINTLLQLGVKGEIIPLFRRSPPAKANDEKGFELRSALI